MHRRWCMLHPLTKACQLCICLLAVLAVQRIDSLLGKLLEVCMHGGGNSSSSVAYQRVIHETGCTWTWAHVALPFQQGGGLVDGRAHSAVQRPPCSVGKGEGVKGAWGHELWRMRGGMEQSMHGDQPLTSWLHTCTTTTMQVVLTSALLDHHLALFVCIRQALADACDCTRAAG